MTEPTPARKPRTVKKAAPKATAQEVADTDIARLDTDFDGNQASKATEEILADPQAVVKIRFINGGLTGLGRVFQEGDKLSVVVGSDQWKRTLNNRGESWLDLLNRDNDQQRAFGRVMFVEDIDD